MNLYQRHLLITLLSHWFLVRHQVVSCFEWHSGGRPEVDRRAIAGLWRLTAQPAPTFSPKEFTVYPKPINTNNDDKKKQNELLLMLKEDGSFQKYDDTDEEDVQDAWKSFQQWQEEEAAADKLHHHFLHGTWDYIDGKLILAADRPEVPSHSDDLRKQKQKPSSTTSSTSMAKDTLLTGRVVATYQTKLGENPTLKEESSKGVDSNIQVNDAQSASSKPDVDKDVDAHLSVPKGSVKVGKFFYPKHHPSFFEQPMYQPQKRGTVTLRQVLGALNAASSQDEPEIVEKFHVSDFYNKTYVVTSSPLGQRPPKGRARWSVRQNKMVHDPPSEAAKRAFAAQTSHNIRVMQVLFHSNNTFSTVAGVGENILRGKYNVIGQDKDQFWMQISRFGFGRSVSGSVYSEGRSLTHDDAKAYWGTIRYEQKDEGSNSVNSTASENQTIAPPTADEEDSENQRLEVKGSVMFGWGIEPIPEARFIMRELSSEDALLLDEDDEEDDEDEETDEDVLERLAQEDIADGIDLSEEDSFQ